MHINYIYYYRVYVVWNWIPTTNKVHFLINLPLTGYETIFAARKLGQLCLNITQICINKTREYTRKCNYLFMKKTTLYWCQNTNVLFCLFTFWKRHNLVDVKFSWWKNMNIKKLCRYEFKFFNVSIKARNILQHLKQIKTFLMNSVNIDNINH